MPVDLLFRVRLALELEQAEVLVDDPIERHANRPRPREHGRVVDRRLVLQVIRREQPVALRDARAAARIVAGAIEPGETVQARDVDDERVAVPAAVRPAHPAIERRLFLAVDEHAAERRRELIDDDDVALALQDLERIRHVRRARHAAHVALAFRVVDEPILEARSRSASASGRYGIVAAFDDAVPRRHGELCAELEQHRISRDVRLEVPVRRVQRLPHAAQNPAARSGARGSSVMGCDVRGRRRQQSETRCQYSCHCGAPARRRVPPCRRRTARGRRRTSCRGRRLCSCRRACRSRG